MNNPDPTVTAIAFVAALLCLALMFISFLIHDFYTLRILQTPYEKEDFENKQPKKPSRIRYIPPMQSYSFKESKK